MRDEEMEYPAKFTPDTTVGGYVVTLPDVPEAITQSDTIEEAMTMASEALESALTFYTERWADLPVPSKPKRGMRMVRVPALSEAKLRLYSELRAAGIRKVELARRLACSPGQAPLQSRLSRVSRVGSRHFGMPGFIQANLASAWQPDLRDRAPSRFLHLRELDAPGVERRGLGLQVVAHQKKLMPIISLAGMEGSLCRRQAEDQPSMPSIHECKSQNVAKEGAVRLRVFAVDDYVRTVDH